MITDDACPASCLVIYTTLQHGVYGNPSTANSNVYTGVYINRRSGHFDLFDKLSQIKPQSIQITSQNSHLPGALESAVSVGSS